MHMRHMYICIIFIIIALIFIVLSPFLITQNRFGFCPLSIDPFPSFVNPFFIKFDDNRLRFGKDPFLLTLFFIIHQCDN